MNIPNGDMMQSNNSRIINQGQAYKFNLLTINTFNLNLQPIPIFLTCP